MSGEAGYERVRAYPMGAASKHGIQGYFKLSKGSVRIEGLIRSSIEALFDLIKLMELEQNG